MKKNTRLALDRAELQGASLISARLQGASLTDAELQGASLTGAQLQGATLTGAQLQGATLDGAALQGASLAVVSTWRADVRTAHWENTRVVNLQARPMLRRKAHGSISVQEGQPNLIFRRFGRLVRFEAGDGGHCFRANSRITIARG
jgi:uncharacterized protein YjbI with pentapeptide repeats